MIEYDAYITPDLAKSALLTIDVQRDFTDPDGAAIISGTKACVPAMVSILDAYREKNLPIIHVIRLYLSDGSNADLCRRTLLGGGKEIVRPGSQGAELVSDFTGNKSLAIEAKTLLSGNLQKVADSEWILYKPRWDAFYNTPLEHHLRELSVSSVTIIGCNFPNCPRTTAYGASMRDLRTLLIHDAVSGTYERGLQELNNIGIATPSSEELLTQLASL